MNAILKIFASSPIWSEYKSQEWPVVISIDHRYDEGNVHSFIFNNEEYLFEIKDTEIHNKILLVGWLSGANKAGNIIFELQ